MKFRGILNAQHNNCGIRNNDGSLISSFLDSMETLADRFIIDLLLLYNIYIIIRIIQFSIKIKLIFDDRNVISNAVQYKRKNLVNFFHREKSSISIEYRIGRFSKLKFIFTLNISRKMYVPCSRNWYFLRKVIKKFWYWFLTESCVILTYTVPTFQILTGSNRNKPVLKKTD